MMRDEIPLIVAIPAIVLAWSCYLGVRLAEARDIRRGAAALLASMRSQRVHHRDVHRVPEQRHADRRADENAERDHEPTAVHVGTIPDAPVILPPGVPSILERLDRWT